MTDSEQSTACTVVFGCFHDSCLHGILLCGTPTLLKKNKVLVIS